MALALMILIFLTVARVLFSLPGPWLRALGWQRRGLVEKLDLKDRLEHAVGSLSKAVPLFPTDMPRTRSWLIQAGYRGAHHLTIYAGSRLVCAFLGVLAAIAISGLQSPILLVGMTGVGFFLPHFALKRKIQGRQHRIKLGLPDALDLTVICVEAGLALDQAMMRVGADLQHAYPDLSDDLCLVSRGMHAGYSWDEALSGLSQRTDMGEIKILVRALVRAGPMGVVRVLRTYSDDLRLARQERARTQVIKSAIEWVLALLVFVIPSVLIVILGPAFIQFIRTFKPVVAH
jgi:tight adherence protein C